MGRNRIELWGRLVNQPELRTTPGGHAIVRLALDCGEAGENLRLAVVMTGDQARAVAAQFRAEQELHVVGRLRSIARGARAARPTPDLLEVLADEISAAG